MQPDLTRFVSKVGDIKYFINYKIMNIISDY
jgi:hypothetical protein